MTTSQLDHLRKIDAHLEHLLEITAKRTPGRWKMWRQQGSLHIRSDNHAVSECWQQCADGNEHNSAYIAACSNNAEAGWQSTRILISSILDLHDTMLKHGCPEYQSKAAKKLLAQWPLELLVANG